MQLSNCVCIQVAVLTEHYELREKELLSRMEASEKTHNKSITELRQLLTAQYRVGSRCVCACVCVCVCVCVIMVKVWEACQPIHNTSCRWREESKTLSHKFEEIITCLRYSMSGYSAIYIRCVCMCVCLCV